MSTIKPPITRPRPKVTKSRFTKKDTRILCDDFRRDFKKIADSYHRPSLSQPVKGKAFITCNAPEAKFPIGRNKYLPEQACLTIVVPVWSKEVIVRNKLKKLGFPEWFIEGYVGAMKDAQEKLKIERKAKGYSFLYDANLYLNLYVALLKGRYRGENLRRLLNKGDSIDRIPVSRMAEVINQLFQEVYGHHIEKHTVARRLRYAEEVVRPLIE